MKERKYADDYGFRYFADRRGKEKRGTVYQGEYFADEGGEPARKRTLTESLALCAAFAVMYVIYMKLRTPSSGCMYVLPVAACALVVLAYWVMGIFSLWRAPLKMTRLQKENSIGRILRSSMGCAVLLGMACVGDLLFMLLSLKESFAKELPGFALLACAGMTAMGCFLRTRETYRRLRATASSKGETVQ